MRCTSRPPRLTALLITTLIAAGQPVFAAGRPIITDASLGTHQSFRLNDSADSVHTEVAATGTSPLLFTTDPTKPVLVPGFIAAGAPPITLTINGANFISGATVLFNGVSLTPTTVSSTKVVVTVPALLLFKEGAYDITVFNPPPDGGSNSVALNVVPQSQAVQISGLRPVPTGTTVVVTWNTNLAANGQIWYGLTNPPTTTFGSTTLQTFHKMTITGLASGTTYFCKVYSSDGYTNQTSAVVTFTTQ